MNIITLAIAVAACVVSLGQRAAAQTPEQLLIEEGRRLFTEETFGGNGRTCATCHPATNNFTIDPAFVRRLKPTDPLFIVRATRELRDLEIKQFLRQGTILENLDGFNNPGVMRGVPHTLALNGSAGRTGWSGDGSPDTTLHTFATGAVTQHFTKTLNRVPGVDFRLPTEHELDAMEAFQRSLGRQGTPQPVATLSFVDPDVERGRQLFLSSPSRDGLTRSCNGCHVDGGTNDGQRATGVNNLPTAPTCQFGFHAPGDGGLGLAPSTRSIRDLCGRGPTSTTTFLGDQTFNTPPVIEAADTPPFFHNNSVATLEGAVAFYASDTFNNSIAGAGRGFILAQDDINAIAAFLRVLNAQENIRSSSAFSERIIDPTDPAPKDVLVAWAEAETDDAIEVLTQGPIKLYPDAVQLLRQARQAEREAATQNPPNLDLLEDAIADQEAAADLFSE